MMSNQKSTSRWWGSPVVLMRLSAILFFVTMLGHSMAYPWTSTTQDPRETMLVEAMKDTPYVFFSHTPYRVFGEHTTYWGLYFGWGLLLPVLLLALAVVIWILSDLAQLGSRSVGAICGIVSAASVVGAYISLRFFFTPPFLTYSVICILLMTAAVQLLRRPKRPTEGGADAEPGTAFSAASSSHVKARSVVE